jgi:23S rRNA (adenine-N6)-dimethyltransferase
MFRRLLSPGSRLVAADLVLQRAMVRRYVDATAPAANRWMSTWEARRGLLLPRKAFQPVPRVDSAVLVIRRR